MRDDTPDSEVENGDVQLKTRSIISERKFNLTQSKSKVLSQNNLKNSKVQTKICWTYIICVSTAQAI